MDLLDELFVHGIFEEVYALFVTNPTNLFCIGDVNSISVGSGTNIQDNSLVHVAKSNLSGKVLPTIIGDNVTVGE